MIGPQRLIMVSRMNVVECQSIGVGGSSGGRVLFCSCRCCRCCCCCCCCCCCLCCCCCCCCCRCRCCCCCCCCCGGGGGGGRSGGVFHAALKAQHRGQTNQLRIHHLSNNRFHKGILGIQTTNPNHQLTIG